MPDLVQQIVEALGPDGVWKELQLHVPSLGQPRNGHVEVRALCPFHDDHRPSWCWNLAKGVATCHVCGDGNYSLIGYIAYRTGRPKVTVVDEYCRRLGLARPRRRPLTLADYAASKRLPADYLKSRFDLAETADGLEIPYFDSSGVELARRLRRRLGEPPRWKGNGVAARRMVYGLRGLPWIGRTGYLFVVEGESDLHTAWYYDLPALGLPGASVGHKVLAETVAANRVHTVFALPDSDAGGWQMLVRLETALKLQGWTGKFLAARLPAKDLSDLHVAQDGNCEAAIWASLHAALPVAEALAGYDRRRVMEDTKLLEITQRVKADRTVGPIDKWIVITAATEVLIDPTQPIPLSKSKLAQKAGVPRRTFYDHLPSLLKAGLLEEVGDRLRLGKMLVR